MRKLVAVDQEGKSCPEAGRQLGETEARADGRVRGNDRGAHGHITPVKTADRILLGLPCWQSKQPETSTSG